MNNLIDLISVIFLVIGGIFFFAGTIGVLRFPDVYTRLHALAKVDNLGLGFTIMGLLIKTSGIFATLKLILIWLLVLIASATVGFLIAQRALNNGIEPWSKT